MPVDLSIFETWLWDAACAIRGPGGVVKLKDYILALVFLKHVSNVFKDEIVPLQAGLAAHFLRPVEQDQKLVRFYLPPIARWESIITNSAAGQSN